MFNTPILFLIFNRLDTAQQVFAKIREVQPKQLFIAADGPRKNKEGEKEKTDNVRKAILDEIDWDCEVKTLFREENLGCGKAVSSAITWFFNNVEQGIILEDDCLPDLSFFKFCEELLEKYKYDQRIFQIGGNNFNISPNCQYSYFFTKYVSIWGWATWRRAWQLYDFDMKFIQDKSLIDTFQNIFTPIEANYRYDLFYKFITERNIDAWGYQWSFCNLVHNGLTILPVQNLISNVGFGEDATHTTSAQSPHYKLKTYELTFPLIHPPYLIRSEYYEYTLNKQIRTPIKSNIWSRLKNKIVSIIQKKI